MLTLEESGEATSGDPRRRAVDISQRPRRARPFAPGLIFHGGNKEIDTVCGTVSLKNDIAICYLSEACSLTRQLPRKVPKSSAESAEPCRTSDIRMRPEIYYFHISSNYKQHRFYMQIRRMLHLLGSWRHRSNA